MPFGEHCHSIPGLYYMSDRFFRLSTVVTFSGVKFQTNKFVIDVFSIIVSNSYIFKVTLYVICLKVSYNPYYRYLL